MGLTTPADYGTHYKCIAHRQMKTNRGADAKLCRLCGREKETILHFGECRALKEVYESLRIVDGGLRWNDTRLNLLGLQQSGVMKRGTAAIHSFTWKHVIPEIVRVEQEGAKFQAGAVLRRAVRRYKKREQAMQITIRLHVNKQEARHSRSIDTIADGTALDRFSAILDGIATVDASGQIVRNEAIERWINNAERLDGADTADET